MKYTIDTKKKTIKRYNIVIELIVFLLPVFFGLHRMFQFKAGVTHREPLSMFWHVFQGAVQICIAILVYLLGGWQLALVFVFWFWLIFDILANIGLGKPWFYVGQTALTDKITRWVHAKVLKVWTVEVWMFGTKVIELIIALVLYGLK